MCGYSSEKVELRRVLLIINWFSVGPNVYHQFFTLPRSFPPDIFTDFASSKRWSAYNFSLGTFLESPRFKGLRGSPKVRSASRNNPSDLRLCYFVGKLHPQI